MCTYIPKYVYIYTQLIMRIRDLLCYCIIYILISTIRVSCYILFAPYSTGDEPVSPTQQYAHVRVEFELELKT